MERQVRPDPDRAMPSQQPRERHGRSESRRSREESRQAPPSRSGYPTQRRTREDARAWQGQRGWQRDGGWQPHNSWREHRADDWQAAHRTWQQRGGYGGYYIPRDRFYTTYGPRHFFQFRPQIYDGYPRFWFGNYWFMIVDPWPGDWDEDWYASGDCYIDFIDGGYYLFDRRHPGIGLAITVMF